MKPGHPDYEFSTKVLNSMDGKGLMNLHDKLHRTPYHKLKNTKNTRSEIQNKILNKVLNYNEIYDNLHEAKDPKEYGYEGEMAMSQLKGILMHAKQLHDMLEPDTDLPEWVQSKITLAYDYIQTASDYMSTEMNEETKWVKDKHGAGYTSSDGKREIVKHPKGWISRSRTDRYDYSDVYPTQKEAKAGKYAWAMNKEEAPTMSAGSGTIAGIGVGPQGEPGVTPKAMKRYKDKNAAAAPKAGRKTLAMFMQGVK